MSFWKTLETIGSDVVKGIGAVDGIVTGINPLAGNILAEVAQVIQAIEAAGVHTTLTPAQISQIVQAAAMTATVKGLPAAGTVTAKAPAAPASS